ncbi:MAG: putative hemagglutinin-related protein, partial [Proteobacteria bacterium]|nr:putative hemagglutinin-related protein [Pseudomonadota bacterium]
MNKHLYRIVFNDTRGQLMVVAETASGDGKSARQPDQRPAAPYWATLRALSFALLAALGLAFSAAHAQIVAYRNAPGNQQPTVLSAGNGVPLINIQTPSAAGVSRNSYSQFDVQSAGAILNNSRSNTQTQLGGWVSGNPWLATGSARVVLNQVTSANPSLLRGYVEVAGSNAQVVIANPAGVTCAGCGFINANRATLTTGTPIVNGGSLDGYRVEGGTIRVEGAGMDASHVDYADLIARAVEINAGVWAKDLKVTAGANQVDAANVLATPIAGSAAAPAFAIDVAHLGGMYANKIVLVGTEAGVGVRNAGTIGAAAGEVVVTADGKLVNPGTLISGDLPLIISTRGIDNAGTLSSENNLTLASVGDVVNSGLLHAGRELSLDTTGQLANRQGTIEGQRLAIHADSLVNDGGTLRQNGTQALVVSAGRVANAAGALIGNVASTGGTNASAVAVAPTTTAGLADGLIAMHGAIDNSGTIAASGAVSLSASAGLANAGTLALSRLDVSGESVQSVRNSGSIAVTSARLAGALLDNRGGTLLVADRLDLAAHDVVNAQGTIRHSGANALSVALAGNLDNRSGQIASNGIDLKVSAAAVDNTGGHIEHAGDGKLTLATNRLDGNGGRIESRGALVIAAGNALLDGASTLGATFAIAAGTLSNQGGSITQTGQGSGNVAVTSRFDNTAGSVASAAALNLSAGEIDNRGGGKIAANGDLAVISTTGALANDGGTVSSQGRLDARIAGELTNASGQLVAGTDLGLSTGGWVNNAGGTLGAVAGRLDATLGGALDNSGGRVEAATAMALSSNGLTNTNGTLLGQSVAIDTRQQSFDNSRGTVSAGGALNVASGTLTNVAGRLQAAGLLTIDSHGQAIANTGGGNILGQASVALTAGALDNSSGTIGAADSLTLTADSLINRVGRITQNGVVSGPITVAGRFDNTGGMLASAAALNLTAGEVDNRGSGKIATNGDLALATTTGALTNDGGTVNSQGRLDARIAGEIGNAGGQLVAGTDLGLTTGGRVNNVGGTLGAVAGRLDATLGGALDNSGGRVEAATALTLTSNGLTNVGGTVLGQSVAIDTRQQTFDNSRGTVAAGGALSVASGTLTNVAGRLQAAGLLTIDSHGQALANTGGGNIIGQASVALTAAGALDNSSGVIGAADSLTLNADSLINRVGRITQNGIVSGPISVAGRLDNTGGMLASAAALNLTAGEIDNRGGGKIASNGDLALTTTTGALANDGGTINSQGRLDARIAGEMSNAGGQLVAGTDLGLTTGGRVDNDGGTLGAVAGRLDTTLGGALDNSGGRVEAASALVLSSNGLTNTNGTLLGQSVAIDTRQQVFDNSRGTVAAGGVLNVASGTLTNVAGHLQAAGLLTIDSHGQTIANTGGNILGQSSVTLTAGALDNSSGLIASADTLAVTASHLTNVGGRLSAQAGMTLGTGTALDNRSGDIQSGGDLSTTATVIDNSGGLMRATGTQSLGADRLVNAWTNADDKGLEGRSLIVAANAIDNRSGALRAVDALAVRSAGALENTSGLISSTRTLAIRDESPVRTLAVTNTGGTIIAGTDLAIRSGRLTGDGRILSHGDLAVDLATDFVNTSEITADRNASIVTAGNLSNSGTLQAGNTLAVQAATLDNTAAGKIAAGTLQIWSAGTLTNRGLIDGGDAFINAASVDNLGTGRIYGNHLAIAASAVNNHPESGVAPVIAARDRLDIGAWAIDNRDGALIFSAGDLAIGGALDANHRAIGQAGAITNASATIEALGNLTINTASLINQKTTFATTRITSGTPTSGIALLDYDPDLRFNWGAMKTGMGPWVSYIRERYLDAITRLLGGGPDAALVAFLNPPPPFDPDKPVGPDNLPPYDPDQPVGPYSRPPPLPYEGYVPDTIWGDLTGYTGPVGGGLDATYRSRLAAAVNGQPLSALDDSHKIWQLLIETIAAEHPEYIDRMARNLAARGPLQYSYRQICVDTDDCDYVTNVVSTSVSQRDVVSADSPAAVIRAGGNAAINATALENRYSVIQSGSDMTLTGATLTNVGAEFYLLTDTTSTSRLWHWMSRDQGSTTSASSTQTLIGSAPAIISAGGALTGSFSNRIDNVVIRQNAARVVGQTGSTPGTSGVTGVGLSTGGAAAAQTVSGTGEAVSSTVHTASAQTVSGTGEAVSSTAGTSSANTASTFGTAPARITRVAATGAASGPDGVVATAALALALPASRLMYVNPDPAGRYLVETDPAFASYRTWLSSDYLLGALALDPATTQKRLGDGFYEQRLILEQVAELTGRRFLSGYASDEAQYRALMAAGATVAREWLLIPGVALSEAQMARLTTDIVWLVEREVTLADGTTSKVLVPQVYARVRDGDLAPSGALIAGNDVRLETAGDLVTSGTIAGRQVVALSAENIADLRGRIAGRDVAVQAAHDLTVLGGSIEAERTLLASAGNDLTVASTTVDRD